MKRKKAIIDLGTNTFHLLIAELDNKQVVELVKNKVSVKVGEGGISKGIITKAAAQRALLTLKSFKKTIDQYKVVDVSCFATSAFRNASNSQELISEVKKETGISIQVINGDREAELIYHGVKHAVKLEDENALIMDIGGGSVEFIICNKSSIIWKKSFEIGGQRLMDSFHQNHEEAIPKENVEKLNTYLNEALSSLSKAIEKHQPQLLIGASGTFDTICDMYSIENKLGISIEKEKTFSFPISYFDKVYANILGMNKSERLKIPGMIEMRVNMIVVAMGLINFILKSYPIYEIKVSNYALKEGALFSSN